MKKLLVFLLTICFTITALSSCDLNKGNKVDEYAEKTYADLSSAAELCKTVKTAVYGAWYFSVYEAENYGYEDILVHYTNRTGISGETIFEAANLMGYNEILVLFSFSDLNFTLTITYTALRLKGTTSDLESALKKAKLNLDAIAENFKEYEHYSNLKSLYVKIDAYSEKLLNPDSMNIFQLKEHIDKYESEITELLFKLDFLVVLN